MLGLNTTVRWLFFALCAAAALIVQPAYSAAIKPDEIGIAPRTWKLSAEAYASSKGFSLRDDGILVYDYGASYGGLGKWANPYFISNYAHALYKDYLLSGKADDTFRARFMEQANYLFSTVEYRDDMAVWAYPFPQPKFNLKPGWISGIGQARIAGVLERAFALTGDLKFHDLSERAMNPYRHTLLEGGVITPVGADSIWIEEAPDPTGVSYKVLNGHITALTGLLDYYQITGEEFWNEQFSKGVNAVRRDIASFDLGYTSLYSLGYALEPIVASHTSYHLMHIEQLLWLADVTQDSVFVEWASRFLFGMTSNENPENQPRYAPIVNWCNLGSSEGEYYHLLLMEGKSVLPIKCDGWLIFQRGVGTDLHLAGKGMGQFTVEASDRMDDWEFIATTIVSAAGSKVTIPARRFVRVSFTAETIQITQAAITRAAAN